MPVISNASLMSTIVNQTFTVTDSTSSLNTIQVVCAWPVSGQYGPGSRVLYYVLVAACVVARKAEWLRNACLAAALLLPAVAALHAIVLAAVHVNGKSSNRIAFVKEASSMSRSLRWYHTFVLTDLGAVDMDVFGAFQLCSIGILAAPISVKLSNTYFNDPGRNLIFLWTILILAGLLSLTVEFYRISSSPCSLDEFNPFSTGSFQFPYGNATCGLTCSVEEGPTSPIRYDAANNIYVIPSPDKFTFNTATLFAAACCVPAVRSLVSMWNKILEINWRKNRSSNNPVDEQVEEATIPGTNGATVENMAVVNSLIRRLLRFVEGPVFFAAVLAILIIGERNLFSTQVRYQTEPIGSIGQWGPIVGTGLAVLGSLYVLAAAEGVKKDEQHTPRTEAEKDGRHPTPSVHHCTCSIHEVNTNLSTAPTHPVSPPIGSDELHNSTSGGRGNLVEIVPTTSRPSLAQVQRSADASRQKVAKGMAAVVNYFGVAAPDRFDDSEFKKGPAVDWPEIPGEQNRNKSLHQIKKQYNQIRDSDEISTHGLQRQRSRAASFTSVASGNGAEDISVGPRASSTIPRSSSAQPPANRQRPSISTDRRSFDLETPPLSAAERPRVRRDTLEVPSSPVHHRTNSSFLPETQSPPSIVVSDEPQSYTSAGISSPTRGDPPNS